jgi:hypothetical protein
MKYMKNTIIILIALSLPVLSFGQRYQNRVENRLSHEEMRSEKVSYLTSELDLSVAEAQKFWPVYNMQEKGMQALIDEKHGILMNLQTNAKTLTKEQLETQINRLVEIENERAAIQSEFHEKFKQVLPIEKIAMLYTAEHGFRRHLLDKYRDRGRGAGMPPPDGIHE